MCVSKWIDLMDIFAFVGVFLECECNGQSRCTVRRRRKKKYYSVNHQLSARVFTVLSFLVLRQDALHTWPLLYHIYPEHTSEHLKLVKQMTTYPEEEKQVLTQSDLIEIWSRQIHQPSCLYKQKNICCWSLAKLVGISRKTVCPE